MGEIKSKTRIRNQISGICDLLKVDTNTMRGDIDELEQKQEEAVKESRFFDKMLLDAMKTANKLEGDRMRLIEKFNQIK